MDLSTVEQYVPAATAGWQPGDVFLAGGSWLFSEPQPGVRRLLDLASYGWTPLAVDPSGLEIAATCTLAEFATFERPDWPATSLFAPACHALLGSFKVWNVATVGGNVCLALPAGPMTSVTAALDGVCTLWSPDGTVTQRPVVDFVTGPRCTMLAPGQLLRAIHLPTAALRGRVAFRRASLTPVGRSAAVVIGRVGADGAVLTVTASTGRPVQLRYPSLPSPGDAARDVDGAVTRWHDDVHGSPRWRRAMTLQLIGEVVEELA